MLELNNNVLKLKFNGEVFEIKHPTIKQFEIFSKKLIVGDKSEVEIIKEFLIDLGLNSSVVEDFELTHLNAIIEEFTKKKN